MYLYLRYVGSHFLATRGKICDCIFEEVANEYKINDIKIK